MQTNTAEDKALTIDKTFLSTKTMIDRRESDVSVGIL